MDHHLTQCRVCRGIPPYQMVSWCIQPFDDNTYGPIAENWGLCPLDWGDESPSNTLWPQARPTTCQVSSWSIQPSQKVVKCSLCC